MERIRNGNPAPGLPWQINQTEEPANILINITRLIPNLIRKNGIVRMNNVSEIWEMDNRILGCVTAKESA